MSKDQHLEFSRSQQERIQEYTRQYVHEGSLDFEETLIRYRQQSVLEYLHAQRPSRVVEVGCGLDLLVLRAVDEGLEFVEWLIVEPSPEFAEFARRGTTGVKSVRVVEGFFEAIEKEDVGDCFDAVICQACSTRSAAPTA